MSSDIRKELISLRAELKDPEKRKKFMYSLGGDFSRYERLLEDEDPKVRKMLR